MLRGASIHPTRASRCWAGQLPRVLRLLFWKEILKHRVSSPTWSAQMLLQVLTLHNRCSWLQQRKRNAKVLWKGLRYTESDPTTVSTSLRAASWASPRATAIGIPWRLTDEIRHSSSFGFNHHKQTLGKAHMFSTEHLSHKEESCSH